MIHKNNIKNVLLTSLIGAGLVMAMNARAQTYSGDQRTLSERIDALKNAFSQTVATQDHGNGGVHGGDGRHLHAKEAAGDGFIWALQSNAKTFVSKLIENARFVSGFLEGHDPLTSMSVSVADDMGKTPPYKIVGNALVNTADGCGLWDDGFPRTASTLLGIANNDPSFDRTICFDRRTIYNLNLTRGDLVGIAVHEHLRHLNYEDNHWIAQDVAALYDDVVSEPMTGYCIAEKGNGKGFVPDADTVDFKTTDLVNTPIDVKLKGRHIQLSAREYKEGGPDLFLVSMSVDGKKKQVVVPWDRLGKSRGRWLRQDFRFELTYEKEIVSCATDPAPGSGFRKQDISGGF